jgi:hypothetical protein
MKNDSTPGPDDKTPENSQKPGVFKRIARVFNKSSRKKLGGVFKQTLKDLRKPQEIALLLGSSFVPGGWIGYGAYRLAKYKMTRPANDNKPPEQVPGAPAEKKQKPAKGKKPPKTPKPPGSQAF